MNKDSDMCRSTMSQLGMVLSKDDVHAMMKSVGIGPHGKISYSGTSLHTDYLQFAFYYVV